MKLIALLFSLVALTACAHAQHHHHRDHRRQVGSPAVPSSSSSSTTSAHSGSSSPASGTSPVPSSSTSSPSSISTGSSNTKTNASPSSVTSVPTGQNGVPPLSMISSGMSTGTSSPLASTYTPGATPPISGAPPLPTKFVFNPADWPTQDKLPDTSSPEVQQWMKELVGFNIPDWSPTADGTCAGDPAAAAASKTRGWWTCGGFTRDTDITACPKVYDWGVSFDDGPSRWSETLLNYLDKKDIMATFFVVGSRVIERSDVLIEEYMAGHEISVHTWSHHPLTSLTNEQIVAELGWTRKAIQKVLGVTPTTMRPPYGDIDDRVRAIALAMGMVPIIWTSAPSSGPFDTNDWRVAGGLVNATTSFNTFESILGNASTLSTGFIVLQHDLYEITVDLAVGYTLNAALTHNPPLSLKPIGTCLNIPARNMYAESNENKTFPYTNHTVITSVTTNSSQGDSQSANAADGRVSVPVSWLLAGLVAGGLTLLVDVLF